MATLINTTTGERVRVHATTEQPSSRYGIPVWVDDYNNAYVQVGSEAPFYEIEYDDIRATAEREGLVIVDTNRGAAAGYFDDFAQAEEIAARYNLRLGLFTRNDGQDTWRYLNDAFEPITITEEDYPDDYRIWRPSDKDDMLDEVKGLIDYAHTFEEAQAIMKQKAEIYKALEEAEDDEIVITFSGTYAETMKRERTDFHFDTKHWLIALYSEDEGRI